MFCIASSNFVCICYYNVIILTISGFYSEITLTVVPSMDDGPIVWKQTVTISCNWKPGNRMYGDMVVGEELGSLRGDEQYGKIVSLKGKVHF